MKKMSFDILLPLFDPSQMMVEPKDIIIPTVDEILDKISERGIESLTETEKEILDNYGKRKNGGR